MITWCGSQREHTTEQMAEDEGDVVILCVRWEKPQSYLSSPVRPKVTHVHSYYTGWAKSCTIFPWVHSLYFLSACTCFINAHHAAASNLSAPSLWHTVLCRSVFLQHCCRFMRIWIFHISKCMLWILQVRLNKNARRSVSLITVGSTEQDLKSSLIPHWALQYLCSVKLDLVLEDFFSKLHYKYILVIAISKKIWL